MNKEIILTILVLVSEYGVPAVLKALAKMDKKELSLQDIIDLRIE